MENLLELLRNNPYPGRGIVVGKNRVYYWIMGRSENSRNRVFTVTDDGIMTEAHDPSKLEDPSLIIYHPVRKVEGALIVTNGDQTDTIRDFGWYTGCKIREYEPDEPNFTPRISAFIRDNGTFDISIIKHNDGACQGNFFCYEDVAEGEGYFISTYQGDGTPLPTFAGEPIKVKMPEADEVWQALNADNKVSLYTNVDGDIRIWNKNLGD